MRISRKAEYAVRAVLDLSLHSPAKSGLRSSEVARRTGVPANFLDAILLELRKSGIISSKRGRDGGHWLARDPQRLSVREILEAIDGPLLKSSGERHPSPADACLRELWGQVAASVYEVVNGVTVEELRQRAMPIDAPDFTI